MKNKNWSVHSWTHSYNLIQKYEINSVNTFQRSTASGINICAFLSYKFDTNKKGKKCYIYKIC